MGRWQQAASRQSLLHLIVHGRNVHVMVSDGAISISRVQEGGTGVLMFGFGQLAELFDHLMIT